MREASWSFVFAKTQPAFKGGLRSIPWTLQAIAPPPRRMAAPLISIGGLEAPQGAHSAESA